MAVQVIKAQSPDCVVAVDNCYGEFTAGQEPCAVSYAALPHHALPCPAVLCSALPCPAQPSLLFSIQPYLALPQSALPCSALPCPAHPRLPFPVQPCLALPCPAPVCSSLSSPALPCPALPCPSLLFPVQPCLALPCPVILLLSVANEEYGSNELFPPLTLHCLVVSADSTQRLQQFGTVSGILHTCYDRLMQTCTRLFNRQDTHSVPNEAG